MLDASDGPAPGATPTDMGRVLVLYVGGTIGMKPSETGYVPSKDYLGVSDMHAVGNILLS